MCFRNVSVRPCTANVGLHHSPDGLASLAEVLENTNNNNCIDGDRNGNAFVI